MKTPEIKEIARLIVENKIVFSTSALQRHYSIGYSKAAQILDRLETMGVISEGHGGKLRQILVDKEGLEKILSNQYSEFDISAISTDISSPNVMEIEPYQSINASYRLAEQSRWRRFDFVLGYEIKLGNTNDAHCDICKRLVGKYPKSFIWDGWHNGCHCYQVAILMSDKEFFSLENRSSVNEIKDVPQGFKDWVIENEDLISELDKRGNQFDFISNNRAIIDKILSKCSN